MKGKAMSMFALTLVFISIFCAAGGQIAMKAGMKQVGEITGIGQLLSFTTVQRMFTNPAVLAGIFLYVISLFLWLGALSTLNISLAYPLVSLAYVLTAIVAFVFLKESMTWPHWVGILLVVAGCFLIVSRGGGP